MKPAKVDYFAPASVTEAVRLLRQYGDEAKLLAGGQSLLPMLNMRLARPAVLIDLNRVAGLSGIHEGDGELVIGAMTRHAELERSPLLRSRQPLLAAAAGLIGHTAIRNRGSIGGSLVHADPSAELPAALVALDGRVRAVGPDGERWVAAADLFVMYFTTCLAPAEILTEVRVPVQPPRTGWAFEELARRDGDFALAAVACTVTLTPAGTIAETRLALTGVGMTPVRATAAEALLAGRRAEAGAASLGAEAAAAAQAAVEPDSDIHAPAEYRRHLTGVLTERALAKALARAVEGGGA